MSFPPYQECSKWQGGDLKIPPITSLLNDLNYVGFYAQTFNVCHGGKKLWYKELLVIKRARLTPRYPRPGMVLCWFIWRASRLFAPDYNLLLRPAELNIFSVYISRRKTVLCAKNAISFTCSMICGKVQSCAATHGTEITTKNKVWLISTFTGWLESEELCMFSISSRSESESYDTEACYTLLSGNGIIALLVDPKWSSLHPPVFVCIMMSAPWTHNSDLSDFRVNTNCF